MFAKQIIVSASLVVVFGSAALAQAEPQPSEPANDEARLQPPGDPSPMDRPSSHERTGEFTVGAGFSTDDHFIARAGVSQSNLFGTGNLLALDATISERRQLFRLRFVNPHLLDTDLSLGAELYSDRRVLPGLTRQANGTSVTLGRPLGRNLRGFIGYRLEDVSAELDPQTALARTTEPALRGGIISAARAGLVYSTLDTPMLPLRGTSAGASIEVADPQLGSELQFTKIDGWANTHQALGPFTLHLGGKIMAIGSRDPSGVPLSERLFLDGSSDIRGYTPGAIGPRNGGNLELAGRATLEMPLIRKIGLSVEGFVDAGAIYNVRGNGGAGRSAGFGLIWRTPIGPLQLDVAYPLDGGPPRFVFGFGSPL